VNQRIGGLGRGLGALIPTGPAAVDPAGAGDESVPEDRQPAHEGAARFAEIPIEAITPNPKQPRTHFDEEALAELVVSIREVGLLQPVVVRELGDERYELIMGERRLRASRELGLERIPAIVRETPDDALLRDALLENLHRQQLNPLEEAAAYDQLLQEFGTTHEELASRIGRSRSHVSNTIRLLNLPPAVQRRVAAGVLSAGHARALLALDDPAAQDRLAERIVAEGLSVRATEEAVALGGLDEPPARRPRAEQRQAPAVAVLGELLSDHLETRVRVAMGRRKGTITIEFGSIDDLERIVAVMAPDVAAAAGAGTGLDRPPTDQPDQGF
jgi:ParB family transcriptional regulator, chromosome partitioning protein